MERNQTRPTVTAPLSALALAAGSATCFGAGNAVGFLSDTAEDIFVVTWLLGWVLLVWAVIVGLGSAIALGHRSLSRRPVNRSQAALTTAALALISVLLATQPLWGTGSAVGG